MFVSMKEGQILKVGDVVSETRSLAYYVKVKIPEFWNFTSKLHVKNFQEV